MSSLQPPSSAGSNIGALVSRQSSSAVLAYTRVSSVTKRAADDEGTPKLDRLDVAIFCGYQATAPRLS